MPRHDNGSAGDADYGRIGTDYAWYRQPDERIARFIWNGLGEARSVLNVGAGAGSYEPPDRQVTAVEPSVSMRAQRPSHLPAAIDGTAKSLPFGDKQFDAAMATFTIHQWPDLEKGLAEMRRVTQGPVVILTGDPEYLDRFWLVDYAPEVIEVEARRYPPIQRVVRALGGGEVVSVPIPFDCSDGFGEAYYGRPERLLDPGVRRACSAWSFVEPAVVGRFAADLERDLASGEWDERHGALRTQPWFQGSLTLIVGRG